MTTTTTALPTATVNGETVYVYECAEQLCTDCSTYDEDVWVTSVVTATVWSDTTTHEVDYEANDETPFCPDCGNTALYDTVEELLEDLRADEGDRIYHERKDEGW
jgi:hypothetical protein